MGAVHRFEPVLPEVHGHRSFAIATSVLGHAALITLLLVLGRQVVEEVREEPVRLVFVEPAPPPKLGVPGGGAQPAQEAVPAAEPPAAAAALEYVAEPALFPPRPEPRPRVRPKPAVKPVAKAKPAPPVAAKPADAPPAGAPALDGASSAEPRGVADGVTAGVVGGLAGGQVGGLGDAITPALQAAVPPQVVHRVTPGYPESARMRGIEGQVVLEAVIARDGTIEPGVKVVQSIPALDEAALAAFERWRFTPGRDSSGKPLRVILQAPVRFVLR